MGLSSTSCQPRSWRCARSARPRSACAAWPWALHGYVTLGLKLWDLAPGSVILQAAGGIVTNGLGAAWMHSDDGSCIASNCDHSRSLITSFGPLNALRKMAADRASS